MARKRSSRLRCRRWPAPSRSWSRRRRSRRARSRCTATSTRTATSSIPTGRRRRTRRRSQAKRLARNFIENNATPLADAAGVGALSRSRSTRSRAATSARPPKACSTGAACRSRPSTSRTPEGAEQLKKLTGEQQAPVLQVGDKLVAKGFNEARWTGDARRSRLPEDGAAPRRRQGGAARSRARAAPPPAAPEAVPVPGSGYPKN